MKQPTTNICPLWAIAPIGTTSGPAVCIEDRCAWFHLEYHQDGDYAEGECALVRIANSLDQIANSKALGIFAKKTAASFRGAGGGKETQQGD